MTEVPPYEADSKDWTWVLERRCPDCGLDAGAVATQQLGAAIRENAAAWEPVLARGDATRRPAATTWSPTEYACHVRDVHRLFAERVEQMLATEPAAIAQFANWNQDEAAVAARYDLQAPTEVWPQVRDAAAGVSAAYDAVPDDAWGRAGARSDGTRFTVASLGRYHLHDVVHHLWDVGGQR